MDIDLGDYAREHICYEVKMLVGTYALLSQPTDMIEHDAALESFLLHARALDDFLGASDPRKSDMVARRYVDTWQPIHPLTPEQRRSVSQRVAHLTEERVRKESIPVLDVLASVAAGFERFLTMLSPEQQPRFVEAAALLASLPPFVIAKATTNVDDLSVLFNVE